MIKKKIVICLFFCMNIWSVAFAAPQEEDFSCRGLFLGDGYETMLEKFGTPRYDLQQLVQGSMVTYYMYDHDIKIGLDARSKKVVDIQIKNKEYTARDGVKLGATMYKLNKTYGKSDKKMIEGKAYYIYQSEKNKSDRLFLEVEPSEGYLTGFRITSLMLAEMQTQLPDGEEDADGSGNDLGSLYIGSKDIDMSNVLITR